MKNYSKLIMRIIALLCSFLVCNVALCSPSIGTLNFEYIINGDKISEDDIVTALNAGVESLDLEELHIFSFEENGHHYVTFATSMNNYAKLKKFVDLKWANQSMRRQGLDSVEFLEADMEGREIISLESGELDFSPDFIISIIRPLRNGIESDLESFLVGYLEKDIYSFNITSNRCCLCLEIKDLDDRSDFLKNFDFGNLVTQTEKVYVYVQD